MTLFDYWYVLYKRKKIIMVTILSAICTALLLSWTIPPSFEAKAVFFVPQTPDMVTFLSPNIPKDMSRTIPLPSSSEDMQNIYLGFLKSDKLANIIHDQFPQKSLRGIKRDVDFAVNNEATLEVYVRDTTPKIAMEIANAYPKYLNEFLSQMSTQPNLMSRSSFGRNIDVTTKKLNNAQNALNKFMEEHRITSITDDVAHISKQRNDFQVSLNNTYVELQEVRKETAAAKAQMKHEAEQYNRDGLLVNSPLVEDIRKRLYEIEIQIAKAKSEYHDNHPIIAGLKEEYEKVQSNLKIEIERIIKSDTKGMNSIYENIRQNFVNLLIKQESLEERAKALTSIIKEIERRIVKFPEIESKLSMLQLEVKRYSDVLNNLYLGQTETIIQEGRAMSNVVVVDHAVVPKRPVFPILWLNLAVSVVTGFIGGILLVFLLDYIQRRKDLIVIDLDILNNTTPENK